MAHLSNQEGRTSSRGQVLGYPCASSMKLHRMEPGRFGVKIREKDQSAQEEVARLVAFPEDPEARQKALEQYVLTNKQQEAIRPWYATLHPARIRGKNVFVCITIEDVPCSRRRKDGSFRHVPGDPGQRSLASRLRAVCSVQTGLRTSGRSALYAGRQRNPKSVRTLFREESGTFWRNSMGNR